jgi:hypothetical protein
MAKMGKEGFSRATIEETKYLLKKLRAKAREQKTQDVEFSGYNKVKSAIQRHPATLRQNQTSGCLLCQNGTVKNPQTRWRCKGTGAPPPTRRRVRSLHRTPPPLCTAPAPPAPTSNTSGAQLCNIFNVPARYTYSHTALPSVEFFQDDEDTERDTDFNPDMLTDEG